jgi:hypothetical protein
MLNNLEDILKSILNKLDYQSELLQLSISNLNTKKAVASYLNKSTATIDNYIKNGTLIKNKHYFVNENNKIEFIPLEILEFKKYPLVKKRTKSINNSNLIHSTVSSILKGISYG